MGLIKEPLEVDFTVQSKPLTQKERELISQHIHEYKTKMAKRKTRKIVSQKRQVDNLKSSTK